MNTDAILTIIFTLLLISVCFLDAGRQREKNRLKRESGTTSQATDNRQPKRGNWERNELNEFVDITDYSKSEEWR